jgi:hypothetical protein
MSKEDALSGLLCSEIERTTPEELRAFRRELKKSLPVLVRECSQKARDTNEREAIVLKCHKK